MGKICDQAWLLGPISVKYETNVTLGIMS